MLFLLEEHNSCRIQEDRVKHIDVRPENIFFYSICSLYFNFNLLSGWIFICLCSVSVRRTHSSSRIPCPFKFDKYRGTCRRQSSGKESSMFSDLFDLSSINFNLILLLLEPLLTLFMFVLFSVWNTAQKTAAQNAHKIILFHLGEYLWLGDHLLLLYLYFLIFLSSFCCCFVWCVPYVFFHIKKTKTFLTSLLDLSVHLCHYNLSMVVSISYQLLAIFFSAKQ